MCEEPASLSGSARFYLENMASNITPRNFIFEYCASKWRPCENLLTPLGSVHWVAHLLIYSFTPSSCSSYPPSTMAAKAQKKRAREPCPFHSVNSITAAADDASVTTTSPRAKMLHKAEAAEAAEAESAEDTDGEEDEDGDSDDDPCQDDDECKERKVMLAAERGCCYRCSDLEHLETHRCPECDFNYCEPCLERKSLRPKCSQCLTILQGCGHHFNQSPPQGWLRCPSCTIMLCPECAEATVFLTRCDLCEKSVCSSKTGGCGAAPCAWCARVYDSFCRPATALSQPALVRLQELSGGQAWSDLHECHHCTQLSFEDRLSTYRAQHGADTLPGHSRTGL